MSYQARYIGLEEVIEAFQKKAKHPYYSLWIKGQPICQYNDGDTIEDVIEQIKDEIEIGIRHQITHEHELILHSKKEKEYTKKSDKYAVIGFRCFELPNLSPGQPMDHNAYTIAAMNQELNRVKSEMAALQAKKIEEEEDDEDDDQNNFMSGFNQFVEHPIVIGMINKWLTGSQPVNNLAGIDNTTLNETINILFSKGVKLEHLQKLAAMPTDKITMLLNML